MGISYQKKRQTPKRNVVSSSLAGGAKNRCKPFFNGLQRFFIFPGLKRAADRENYMRSNVYLAKKNHLRSLTFLDLPAAVEGSAAIFYKAIKPQAKPNSSMCSNASF